MFQFGYKSSKEVFFITYEALLKCEEFIPSLAPFLTRVYGPTSFRKDFPTTSNEDEEEINAIWEAYLMPTLLSSRITAGGPYGLYGYQPNHVARKFGLIQPKPSSLYKCLEDLEQPLIEHVWRSSLRRINEKVFAFEPVPFAASFACTKAFFRWWQDYYKRQANQTNPDTLLLQLISAFDVVQNKLKKSKGTHIREIQAFQKYFQTIYDPLHLKRTVNYVVKTLMDKTFDKIPTIKFPPFTPISIFLRYILKWGFHHCPPVSWPRLLGRHTQNGYPVIHF